MSWARLDDAFWRNPKILAAGNEAAGLYARALSYSADNETAGFLTTETVRTLAPSRGKALARKLVDNGLWEDHGPEGWCIHDYDDPAYGNPATVKARARSEAAKKGANARWNKVPSDANGMRVAFESHSPPHSEPRAKGNTELKPEQCPVRASPQSQSQSPIVETSPRDGLSSRAGRRGRAAASPDLRPHSDCGLMTLDASTGGNPPQIRSRPMTRGRGATPGPSSPQHGPRPKPVAWGDLSATGDSDWGLGGGRRLTHGSRAP